MDATTRRPRSLEPHTRRAGRRRTRLLPAITVGAALALLASAVVLGQEALGGKLRADQQVTVPAGETVTTDLYLAGGTIVVDGTVEGDLVAAGGTVTVNGTVSGDILAAGGTVRIAGETTGDVRVAAGQITVTGAVGEDLLVAGGQVDLTSSGTVGEDVIASAGQLVIDGSVTGSVTGGAGTYQRGGTVGGTDDVVVQPPELAPERTVDVIGDAIRHFLVVVLVGLLALWLAPRLTRRAAASVHSEPLRAVGWGLAVIVAVIGLVIVIPIIAVLVALALAALGFDSLAAFWVFAGIVGVFGLLLGLGFLAWIVADAIVGLALARLVWRTDDDAGARRVDWGRLALMLAAGAAVVVILTSLPILGPWLKLVVVVLGIGALVAAWQWRRRAPLPPASAPVSPAAPPTTT